MTAAAALLPDCRLHLQHGPIDCLCRAWGDAGEINRAYAQAAQRFSTVLEELCQELQFLRTPLPTCPPRGIVARRMHAACTPYSDRFITPMAAVAGAVADEVLAAMCDGRSLPRGYVNNGGDIAFHLMPGAEFRCGLVADLAAPALDGIFSLRAEHAARGLATSGRACKGQGGRSFSFGIADAVTVLARCAAEADAAATVIANAVDLPGHPSVVRRAADAVDPDSDLGGCMVTWEVGPLSAEAVDTALDAGRRVADALLQAGRIEAAVLTLRGRFAGCGLAHHCLDHAAPGRELTRTLEAT